MGLFRRLVANWNAASKAIEAAFSRLLYGKHNTFYRAVFPGRSCRDLASQRFYSAVERRGLKIGRRNNANVEKLRADG
jgi:hypothetical protein